MSCRGPLPNAVLRPASAVEVRRGPLLFTYPLPGRVNVTSLNGTLVQQTRVDLDRTGDTPWMIALQNPPDTTDALPFSGFAPLAAMPFDRAHPPATIRVQARSTTGLKGYDKGNVPDGPVPLSACNGSLFDAELVPLAHSHLRLTVLPVLADE